MPLIGDELRTILGMMPVRDRAGIPRGTMADEALKSASAAEGNAEGQALMQQRPPQIQLPPMGGPQADVTLPDDVSAEYASGRKKSSGVVPTLPIPVPQERVVASSPAAAPSQAVATRASDVMMAAMQQRDRQQKMMQLVGSLGLIANAFNRNPTSQASTRSSLADMIGGGGGGGKDLAEIKTLTEMRTKEDEAIETAKRRENGIQQGMLAHGLTRERATYLYDSGALADRDKPAEMREAQKIRDTELLKNRLRPMAPEIAKARGTDVRIIESMIDKDPDAVAKLAEAEGLTDLTIKQNTATKGTIDNTNELAELKAFTDQLRSLPPDQREAFLQSPSAVKLGFGEQAKRAATKDDASREKLFTHYVEKERPEGQVAETYLTHTARAIGDIWHPNITTGTVAPLRQALARAAQTFIPGAITPDLNDTAAVNSLLKASAVEGLKAIGGNDSNADLLHASAIKGSTDLGPAELRSVAVINEKAAREKLQKERDRHAAYMKQNPDMASKFGQLPMLEMPPPSKLLMADIYHPDPRLKERNAQLRSRLETYYQQAIDNPDPTTEAQYNDVARRFNAEYGAGMASEYLKEQRARKGS